MANKDSFQIHVLKNPEAIFDRETLYYSMHELDEAINRFDRALPQAFYPALKKILRATETFLAATDPKSELRRITNTEADIRQKITNMETAWDEAQKLSEELAENDKKIFDKALHYCKMGIQKHVDEFKSDPLLQSVWENSNLKMKIEMLSS